MKVVIIALEMWVKYRIGRSSLVNYIHRKIGGVVQSVAACRQALAKLILHCIKAFPIGKIESPRGGNCCGRTGENSRGRGQNLNANCREVAREEIKVE